MNRLIKISLETLNKEIHAIVQNNRVNNLKMFVSADKKSKLSVTLEPDHDTQEMYHGLHPNFNDRLIRNFLNRLKNNSSSEFWINVRKIQNEDFKLLHLILTDNMRTNAYLSSIKDNLERKDDLEISLLGKAILHNVSHYGYQFKCIDKGTFLSFKQTLIESSLYQSLFWDCSDKEQLIKLYGLWPDNQINNLTSIYDAKLFNNFLYIEKSASTQMDTNMLKCLLTFKGDWETHFKLLTSEVYYSGVLPCVRKIEYEINPLLQGRIKYLIFHVIRTTFATVDTFDNAHIMGHPFFQTELSQIYLDHIIEFDRAEDALQETYLYREEVELTNDTQFEYEINCVKNLNMYLMNSLNTHTIAVLVNLITSDGYLIAAKRGQLSIDAGEYYCSANGQTEFKDDQVEFYRKSVFEDMPTMDFQSKYRVDLTNEAQRECIAELGTASFDLNWNYYGVSYLSIHHQTIYEENKPTLYRRMHFNVMVSNELKSTFKEVNRNHRNATERFENESLIGIKIRVYRNIFDVIKTITINAYNWLDINKSRIFLFLIIISILIGKQSITSFSLSNYYDLFLIIGFLVLSILKFTKDNKIRKRMITKDYFLPLYKTNGLISLRKTFRGILKKKEKAHAIFSLMYCLHFLSLIQNDE